jgi:hypothetical protein
MSPYCSFRLNKIARCFVYCALASTSLPALADSMTPPPLPPLHPTRDVTVTYVRSDGFHVVIKTAKGGYPFRVEYPDQKASNDLFDGSISYFVALSPKGKFIPQSGEQIKAEDGMQNGFYIWQDSREFDYLHNAAKDWIGQMKLIQYNGSDLIAGITCDQWTIENPTAMTLHGKPMTSGQDRVCLSSDGVILRYLSGLEVNSLGRHEKIWSASYMNAYPSSMIAESVSFEPLPAKTFAIPTGYKQRPVVVIPPPPLPDHH